MILFLYCFGLMLIAYFLVIQPQGRRKREHRRMLAALTPGTAVVTREGFHGSVAKVDAEAVSIISHGGAELKFDKDAIVRIVETKTASPS